MVDFITVPFGKKSSGMEVFEADEEELVREHTYRNGNYEINNKILKKRKI